MACMEKFHPLINLTITSLRSISIFQNKKNIHLYYIYRANFLRESTTANSYIWIDKITNKYSWQIKIIV